MCILADSLIDVILKSLFHYVDMCVSMCGHVQELLACGEL